MASHWGVLVMTILCWGSACSQSRRGYKRIAWCVGAAIELRCEANEVIEISAVEQGYGTPCRTPSPPDWWCTATASSLFTNDVKRQCNGQNRCAFTATSATKFPKHCGYSPDSNANIISYHCMSETKLIDVCSDITREATRSYIVSPGFPYQVNMTNRPMKCSCVLTTDYLANFYVWDMTHQNKVQDCSFPQQILTIEYTDEVSGKIGQYRYLCNDLSQLVTPLAITRTKRMTVTFSSTINDGRFWIAFTDKEYQKPATIRVQCNGDLPTTAPPHTTQSRRRTMGGTSSGQSTVHVTETPSAEGTTAVINDITPSMASFVGLSGSLIGGIVGGIVGVLLVIVLLVVGILCYRKRRKQNAQRSVHYSEIRQKATVNNHGGEEDYPEDHTYAEVTERMVDKRNPSATTAYVPTNRSSPTVLNDEYAYAYSGVPGGKTNNNRKSSEAESQGAYAYADVSKDIKPPESESDAKPEEESRASYAYAYGTVPVNVASEKSGDNKAETENKSQNSGYAYADTEQQGDVYAVVDKAAKKKNKQNAEDDKDEVEFIENTIYEGNESGSKDAIPNDVELTENDIYE